MHAPAKGRWRPPHRGRGGAPDYCFFPREHLLSSHLPLPPLPPGAPAPRVLFGVPPHPIPNPWEGDDRGVGQALRRGGLTTDLPLPWAPVGPPPNRDTGCGLVGGCRWGALAPRGRGGRRAVALLSRGSPLPTPPMPGHLDVVEGLSLPARVRRMRARAGG